MQQIFEQTARRLQEWQADEGVVGVLLVGSKSHEHGDDLSDDDLEVLLTDEAYARLAPVDCLDVLVEGEGDTRRIIYDTQYLAFSALSRRVSSHLDLDHWPYRRAGILFDRDGQVGPVVKAVAEMSPEFRHTRLLHATIDAWGGVGRARKTTKRGFEASTRFLIARGAKALARLLFALEWRWVPLDHWLESELKTLEDPFKVGDLLVEAMVNTSPDPIVEALTRLEDRLFEEGVPRAADRLALFLELIHPSRAAERAIHGLV